MFMTLTKRFIREATPRTAWNFAYKFGWKGLRAVQHFQRRQRRGRYFPAFLFLSVTSRCNLRCKGCWVSGRREACHLTPREIDRVINACRKQGSHFFGIMGGEPLLYDGLVEIFQRHRDCYFLLFTNGTLLNTDTVERLARAGNVSPLISIEGDPVASGERRGRDDVYVRSIEALENCRSAGLVSGVASSVCQNSFDAVVSDRFVEEMAARGAFYLWYYIYRPVGPEPSPELALDEEQVYRLREFIVDVRCRAPLMVVDAYWDHEGRALCPAVTGIGHHINPDGDIELCPPIQFAADNINDDCDLEKIFEQSSFLRQFGPVVAEQTRGCVLLDRPELLHSYVKQHGGRDSSGRGTAFEELAAMRCRCSHHLPGREIPEKSWAYRFAKKNWFFGFGAYG